MNTLNPAEFFEVAWYQQTGAAVELGNKRLPHWPINSAVRLMLRRSPIIVTGMGKSGHVGMKAAATFRSLGFPAHFLHPGEASHGDLGMIVDNSVVLAISNSGETRELSDILTFCKKKGHAVIAITSHRDSTLSEVAICTFDTGKLSESCPNGLAPTTSTMIAMLICDSLASALACTEGRTPEDFHRYHPGGKLGAELKTATNVMKPLPTVRADATMGEAARQMEGGAVAVLNAKGKVVGICTDGDVRRRLPDPKDQIETVMTTEPLSAPTSATVSDLIKMMNLHRVTSLILRDQQDGLVGIVHMQDCLKLAI